MSKLTYEDYEVSASKRYKIAVGVIIFILLMVLVGSLTGRVVSGSGVCGDLVCSIGENTYCPADCLGTCGNGVCEPAEELTCAIDCNFITEKQVTLLDGILSYFQ